MNRAYHGLLTVGIAAAALAVLVLPGKVDSREPRVRRRSPRPVTVAPAPTVFPDLPNPIAPAPEGFPGKVIGTWGKVAFVWVDGEGFVVEVKEEFRGWRLESCDTEGADFGNGSRRVRVPITSVATPQEPILIDDGPLPIDLLPLRCEPVEGFKLESSVTTAKSPRTPSRNREIPSESVFLAPSAPWRLLFTRNSSFRNLCLGRAAVL